MTKHQVSTSGSCPVEALIELLGRKHMLSILRVLTENGTVRYNEILGRVSLSPTTLSRRLQELTEVGIVERKSIPEIPPRVDYSLTPKGIELDAVFSGLNEWAGKHSLEK